jgi:hypothetical protein
MSMIRTKSTVLVIVAILAIPLSSCVPGTLPTESTVSPATATVGDSTLPPATLPPEGYLMETASPPPDMTSIAVATILSAKQTIGAMPTGTALPPATARLGIFDDNVPPYSTDTFWSGGKVWYGYANSVLLMVHAGSRGDDHQQGVVLIVTDTSTDWYDTPEKDGTLTITSANGTVLSLTATNGAVYQFNVATRSFVSPTGNPNVTPTGAVPAMVATAQQTAAP